LFLSILWGICRIEAVQILGTHRSQGGWKVCIAMYLQKANWTLVFDSEKLLPLADLVLDNMAPWESSSY
jgi:hypothetical protein